MFVSLTSTEMILSPYRNFQILKSLTDLDNFPEPDQLAEEIIENLEAGLDSFREVRAGLEKVA